MQFKYTFLVLSLAITGCGSDKTETSPEKPNEQFYAVKVIDGYLTNATVWLDINGDYKRNTNEPYADTKQGLATLDVTGIDDFTQYALVSIAEAGKTIDAGLTSHGSIVAKDFLLTAPPSISVVTPLTTVVALDKQPHESAEQARNRIAIDLDIEPDIMFSDFSATNHARVLQTASSLVSSELLPTNAEAVDDFTPHSKPLDFQLKEVARLLATAQSGQVVIVNTQGELELSLVDSDGDGVGDVIDAFPLDPSEQTDTDTDGIGNNSDLDDDNDGLSDDIELTQGSDPLKSNKLAYQIHLIENFQEIQAQDSTAVTDDIFNQVSTKSQQHAQLSWSGYSGSPLYDDDNGEAIFNDMTLNFMVNNIACPQYTLTAHYSRSSSKGTRTFAIHRLDDNATLLPTEDISVSSEVKVNSITVNTDIDRHEELEVIGRRALLQQLEISATCEVYDLDLDGLNDQHEQFLGTNPLSRDTDNDGLTDSEEVTNLLNPLNPDDGAKADSDGDGINNRDEIDFKLDLHDPLDAKQDADSDGIPNDYEIHHNLDPNLFVDAALDADGDGLSNLIEYQHNLDPNDSSDADQDRDNDGLSNRIEIELGFNLDDPSDGALADSDGDGVPNGEDKFILDPTESQDSDGDDIGNNQDTDDDNDGVADSLDAFPEDGSESLDSDGDGIGNNQDTDDDNDGISDDKDTFPTDPSEDKDTDGDGIGNNRDDDSDNDGINDNQDAFPEDNSEWKDTDGDGLGNNKDLDDDGDGVPDEQDAFPRDPSENKDTDGDGTGNNADLDDDNDGIEDTADSEPLISTHDYDILLTEDFQELVTLSDNQTITNQDLGLLSIKVSDGSSLSLTDISPSVKVDTDNGIGLYQDKFNLTMTLSNLRCSSYQYEIKATRMTRKNVTRDIKVIRVSDGLEVIPLTSVADSAVILSKEVNSTNFREPEQLRIIGNNAWIEEINVKATCQTRDSDMDGLFDDQELAIGTDVNNIDSDADGITDGDEFFAGLDPLVNTDGADADSDADGINNRDELHFGLDPLDPADALYDLDNDGINNREEIQFGYSPIDALETPADNDNDGSPDLAEKLAGTNPYYSNLIDYSNEVLEEYLELERLSDNQVFTADEAAMLSVKQRYGLSLLLAQYGNGINVDTDGEVALYGSIDLNYQVNNHCDNYGLSLRYSPSSSSGTRDFEIVRANDNQQILPLKVFEPGLGGYTDTFAITKVNGGDNIHFTGSKAMVHWLKVTEQCVLFDSDLDGLVDIIEVEIGTDKMASDSDNDGLTDSQEINNGLSPIDSTDGYDVDSDGDGFSNGIEIEHGFDPLDDSDIGVVDSDGDGYSNAQELQLGLDPFDSNDLNYDHDNDGLSTGVEIDYFFDPFNPLDGADADSDNDGLSNGDEINAGLNPNSHKLQLEDSIVISLVVRDTDGNNTVNADDEKEEVILERYSLRSDKFQLVTFDPAQTENNGITVISNTPEVRTYRGRLASEIDSNIIAVILPNCTVAYTVFYGYNADQNWVLSADGSYYASPGPVSIEDLSVCQTNEPSLAKYQLGHKPDVSNWNDVGGQPTDAQYYWPKQGDDYHHFVREEALQVSYQVFSDVNYGNSNLERALAFAEYQNNLTDYAASRQFAHTLVISDAVIEIGGNNIERPEFTANYSEVVKQYWTPRLAENPWYELGYWVSPKSSHGWTNGTLWQASPGWNSQNTVQHEMGHMLGCKHECAPERAFGNNSMRGVATPTSTTILTQRSSASRLEIRKPNGFNLLENKRVPYSNWPTPPIAQPDHFSVYRNESKTFDLLNNDEDPNNDTMMIKDIIITDFSSVGANESNFSINSDNTVTFTPPKAWVGLIDAYYILEDESGQATRGLLHINVEPKGISDYYSLNNDSCQDKTEQPSSFTDLIDNDSLTIKNWGYKTIDPNITPDNPLDCTNYQIAQGADKEAFGYQLTQSPFYQQSDSGTGDKSQYHPHIWEVNDKSFTFSFWFRPKVSLAGEPTYHELASRGRNYGSGWLDDGWIISAVIDPENNQSDLIFTMNDKNKLSKGFKTQLTFDVPALFDSTQWQQAALVIDWDTRKFSGYLNGQLLGSADIPEHYSYVSTSGTGETYGRGSYAKVGQNNNYYSTKENNGVDEIVVSHTALTDEQILAIFNKELPAISPSPANGSTVTPANLASLSWGAHDSLNDKISGYDVYLSEDEDLVINSDETVKVASGLSEKTFDISSMSLTDSAYYWKVTINLNDGSQIGGDTWSVRNLAMQPRLYRLRQPQSQTPSHIIQEIEDNMKIDYGHDEVNQP